MARLTENQLNKEVSNLNESEYTLNDRIQFEKRPATLKSKLSIITFILVCVVAVSTAYTNESIFMDKIAVCLFIISCIGLISVLSGNTPQERKNL